MTEDADEAELLREVVADTHAIVWFLHSPGDLSIAATEAMDLASSGTIYISAITLVEVAYLVDKGRLDGLIFDQLSEAVDDPASRIVEVPLTIEVARSLRRVPRKFVPDMPDRILAATALHLGLPLVSRDSKIRASTIQTIW